MKRYCSVKEASELLGVSTNTIYKYLSEGKLGSRRIGKGKIKIIYSSLEPYINTVDHGLDVDQNKQRVNNQSITPDTRKEILAAKPKVFQTPNKFSEVESGTPSDQENKLEQQELKGTKVITVGKGDYLFFRIFKLLMSIGFGIILLTTSFNKLDPKIIIDEQISQLLSMIFPFVLLIGGSLGIIMAVYNKVSKTVDIAGHIIFAFVLGYYSYVYYSTSQGAFFIFTFALTVVLVDHLIRGLTPLGADDNFSSRFSKYLIAVFVITGILFMKQPYYFGSVWIGDIVEANKSIVGFAWFGLFIPVLIYFATPKGVRSKYLYIAYIPSGILLVLFAISFAGSLEWGTAYASYLTGIFTFFLVSWRLMKLKVNPEKLGVVFIVFVWSSLAILFALIAVHISQDQLKKNAIQDMQLGANEVIDSINDTFTGYHSLMIPMAGSEELVEIIIEDNRESAIGKAKVMYDQLGDVRAVLILNEEGYAIGVYPRNEMIQGTNFSSRDYFVKTKESYSQYISPVFKNVLNNKSVGLTEPVFKDNKLIGVLVVGIDLSAMKQNFQQLIGSSYQFDIEDLNGTSLFDDEMLNEEEVDGIKSSRIGVNTGLSYPEWRLTIDVSEKSIVDGASGTNFFISTF